MAKLLIAKAKNKHKSISPSLAAGNWDVRKSVEVAEHSVKLNKIIGHTQNTKAGFGKTAHFLLIEMVLRWIQHILVFSVWEVAGVSFSYQMQLHASLGNQTNHCR